MTGHDDGRTDIGMVKIHDNVIASIAALAATEIEGVKEVERNLKSGLGEFLGKGRTGAISVERDKNGEIIISVPIIVKYGYNVPEVAGKVQENIRHALEKMINISIKDINIKVQGIERGN